MINLSMKLKRKVASCGSRMQKKNRGSLDESDRRAHISPMWGLWVTAETISKNMESLGDSSTENRVGVWSLTFPLPP